MNLIPDLEFMFKVLVQSSNTSEKAMRDLQACHEDYDEVSIDNVGWVISEHNLADGFTKINVTDLNQA